MYDSRYGVRLASAAAALALATPLALSGSVASPVAAEPRPVPALSAPLVAAPAVAAPSVALVVAGLPASSRAAGVAPVTAARPSRAVANRPSLAMVQAKFTNFTLRSEQTTDMRGIEPSLYRGKYYNSSTERVRLCIVERESEGHYDVVSPSGSYFGAYQVSRALARGATWMMAKEHKALLGEAAAKRVLADLRTKPMNQWPRYWQDAAWATVANWDGTGSGLKHWAGGRWHC